MMRQLVRWVLVFAAACLAQAGTATRSFSLPDYGLSEEVTVSVQFAPLADESFNTLEETVPSGWTLVSNGGASWDSGTRRLRWLASGGLQRTFSFVVRAPASGEATAVFAGTAAFDGTVVDVVGASSLSRRSPGLAVRAFGGGATAYRPGVGVAVSVLVTPASGTAAYAVEDVLPTGWTASGVSHGGVFSGGKVTWSLFVDETARTLSYTATAPSGATGPVTFNGVATFDGRTLVIGGNAGLERAVDVAGTVTRSMPAIFHTGEVLTVTLAVTPDVSVQGYSVTEDLPVGWTARNPGVSGAVSLAGRRVIWGPFLDATPRVLTYEAVPDPGTFGTGEFTGVGSFSDGVVTTGGVTLSSWESLEDGTVTRSMPVSCRVGTEFEVILTAHPNEYVALYSVTEVVPEGYTVSFPAASVGSPAGNYVAATRTLTWGPMVNEGSAATLRYRLTAGVGAQSAGVFSGTATFGSVTRPADGPAGLTVLPALLGTATRTLPVMVEPGTAATVRVVATPDVGIFFWVLDEFLPPGWTIGTLPAGATYDASLRRIRYGPFNDDQSRTLEYTATAGVGAAGDQVFAGTATFGGFDVSVDGDDVVVANARPTLSNLLDQVVGEDTAAVFSFLVSDDLTASGSLVVTASSSNPALAPNAGLVLGVGVGGVRTLTVGLAANVSGTSVITVGVSDGTYTTTRHFQLTVTPVNDAPGVGGPGTATVQEEGTVLLGALTVSDLEATTMQVMLVSAQGRLTVGTLSGCSVVAGSNGSGSVTLSGTVTQLNAALATVRFAPGADFNGTATVEATVSDLGASGSGGALTVSKTVTVTVTGVNDAPSFVKGADVVVDDNAGAQTVVGWAGSIRAGPADEAGQPVSFEVVSNSAPALFAVAPAVGSDGTLSFTPAALHSGSATIGVRVRDGGGTLNGGVDVSGVQTFTITVQKKPRVVGRMLFYNQSRWDGNSALPESADDGAIATDKVALVNGAKATFVNYSSFSRGITGIMVDVWGLVGTPTVQDFTFRTGNSDTPGNWTDATAPGGITVRAGAGVSGSDRVTLVWASGAVRNVWLQVGVKATAQTGLADADVFYFGNLAGETGGGVSSTAKVDSTDLARIRLNLGNVGITSVHDINRDGKVNSTDLSTVRLNITPIGGGLRLIDLTNFSGGGEGAR